MEADNLHEVKMLLMAFAEDRSADVLRCKELLGQIDNELCGHSNVDIVKKIVDELLPLLLPVVSLDRWASDLHDAVIGTVTNIVAAASRLKITWDQAKTEDVMRKRLSVINDEMSTKDIEVYPVIRKFTIWYIALVLKYLEQPTQSTLLELRRLSALLELRRVKEVMPDEVYPAVAEALRRATSQLESKEDEKGKYNERENISQVGASRTQEPAEQSITRSQKLPSLRPIISFPYLASLSISPDEEMVSWVSDGKPGAFNIVIASTSSGSEVTRFQHPGHVSSYYPPDHVDPPKCFFVGNDRLLVMTHLYTEDITKSHLALFDVRDGRKTAEIDLDKYLINKPCVRHDTKTIAADVGYDLIVVEAESDNLAHRTIRTDQIFDGPRFGPDGRIYAIDSDGLYRIEGDAKVHVMKGSNSFCFDPAGKVYCGGGYNDRSGNSALHIADMNDGTTVDIAWGREPINVIELAGHDHLLVSHTVDTIYAFHYPPNTVVTLFSVRDRRKKWAIDISDLIDTSLISRYGPAMIFSPVLLTVPNKQWALIQTGRLLKRISLHDGKPLDTISKQQHEIMEAMWLHSKEMLCLARKPDREANGTLELYKILSG